MSAAADLGIDIAAHRSSRFTGYLADWADLILTMTAEHRGEVLAEAPDAAGKTFTLKGFSARQTGREMAIDEDVVDPLGMTRAEYLKIAREIEGLIDEIVPALTDGRLPLAREA